MGEPRTDRTRRQLIIGAAGAIGAVAAASAARITDVSAAQGSAVILGQDNTGATSRTGVFVSGNTEFATLADSNVSSKGYVGVYGSGRTAGVRGDGSGSTGTGVIGNGSGAQGTGVSGTGAGTSAGVEGQGGSANAPGVAGGGGGTSGSGVEGYGAAPGGVGVRGYGTSQGAGMYGQGSGGSLGVWGSGDPQASGVGVQGSGTGASAGMVGRGGPNSGPGVQGYGGGNGPGVQGVSGIGGSSGVYGSAAGSTDFGVTAEAVAPATALRVIGTAAFSTSGSVNIAYPAKSATLSGVELTASSLLLATVQNNVGASVAFATPNVSRGSVTIVLNKAPAAGKTAKVAWFVVN